MTGRELQAAAAVEEALGREIVEERKRVSAMAGDVGSRTQGHYTEAARVCKIRAEALRRMASEAEEPR